MTDHRVLAGRINARLSRRYRLQAIGGAPEPLYLPARDGAPARIHYTRDHVRSLLHELAHWCLAGLERRQRVDFGYGYEPPPRSAEAQRRFFRAERNVQALEQLFSEVCDVPFEVSVDDVGAVDAGVDAFARAVSARAGGLRAALLDGPAGDGDVAATLPGVHARTRAVLSALR